MRATCPSNIIIYKLFTPIVFYEDNVKENFSMYNILYIPLIISHLDSNIYFSFLFSKTFNLFILLRWQTRD
jgi:hypothetical protein